MNERHDDPTLGAPLSAISEEILPTRVLVVDDVREIRESIALYLRHRGFQVATANNGLSARLMIQKERPDLVVSDLEMPVADGWELLEYCRAQYPATPVVIMSGRALGRRPEIECWAAGSLAKPFDLVRLCDEVHRLTFHAA